MRLENDVIGTGVEYFEKLGKELDWDETGDESLVSMKEYELVCEIIALQVSFWAVRRLSNCCGSNVDTLKDIINSKILEYESKFGEFENFNREIIW